MGFNGELASTRIVTAIRSELHQLDGFDSQFRELVEVAVDDHSELANLRRHKLLQNEQLLALQQDNLTEAIANLGRRESFERKLAELDERQKELALERFQLETLADRRIQLPNSVEELRGLLLDEFTRLSLNSPEFGSLLQQLVPEFHVYLVRLIDGGHPLPRARLRLDLTGHVTDAEHVPELKSNLSRLVTVDLFERPPQRERIREETVRLAAQRVPQRDIARRLIHERPKLPVVQQAISLAQRMEEMGVDLPYLRLREPPEDYPKLRRHKNGKYRFEPQEGYEPPVF